MARRWYSYGPDVSAWIEANCVPPSGEHIGRPFRLMPPQKDWTNELYACDAKGHLLRYRRRLPGNRTNPETSSACCFFPHARMRQGDSACRANDALVA